MTQGEVHEVSELPLSILPLLPREVAEALQRETAYPQAEELRLRAGRPVSFYTRKGEHVCAAVPSARALQSALAALCGHSLPAYAQQLRQGFFTLDSGIRIGVAGRAAVQGRQVQHFLEFTSLCIRFPRAWTGLSRQLLPYLCREGQIGTTLLISPPRLGKTTVLRDLIRICSAGEGTQPVCCAVVDERGELSGGGRFDLGPRTDVLLFCPKAAGLEMALRALSPQLLATDEIAGGAEISAVRAAAAGGVKLLLSAHAGSLGELRERPGLRALLSGGLVERVVQLSGRLGRGTVEQIWDGAGEAQLKEPFLLEGGWE